MVTSNQLILASNSQGRRWLLEKAGYTFQIQPADIPEPETGFAVPRTMVQTIAWLKASTVAARTRSASLLQQTQLVGLMENHYSNHVTANMHGR